MNGYKGFDKDLKCRGYQYEIGKTYNHDGEVNLCCSGLHFCENPLDVFNYYPPSDSRFASVEANSVSKENDGSDSKRVASQLHISAELSLTSLLRAGVKFILDKVDFKNAKEVNTGDYSAATNTGARSAATNTGDYSAATNTGTRSAATNTGDYSAATNTGDCSAATNTGAYSAATNTGARSAATNTGYASAATNTGARSAATNTGDYSAATNTGARSAATNTGDYSAATNTGTRSAATNTGYASAATNTGDYSAATNTGKEGCAVSLGIEGKASGAVGCWLTLAEWKQNKYGIWHRVKVVTRQVDEKRIKANTFYILKGGKFVKAASKQSL